MGTPVSAALVPVPVPRLPDSSESVTGKRSPTKKVAGFPSCARSRTCLPLRTNVSASEKWAATAGRVSRNLELPPPTTVNPGMLEKPCALKICPTIVSKFAASVAAARDRISFGLIRKACAEAGGVMPSCRALFRSTSSISISSITSPRAFSTCWITSPASSSLSGASRTVIERLRASSSMCVAPVISRNTRSNSVISSGATDAGNRNVCCACKPNWRRFSVVSGATKMSVASIGRQNVPVCSPRRDIAVLKSTSSKRSRTLRVVSSGSNAAFRPKACATCS